MKLKIAGNRIVSTMADEGRSDTFAVEVVFRQHEGQIAPTVIFMPRQDSGTALADRDLSRVVHALGPIRVIPWSGKPFVLSQAPVASESGGQLQSFKKFKKFGVIGART